MVKSRKILLVEDEMALANVLKLEFINDGFSVKHAENGQLAINFLKKEKFDIVLLDVVMPTMDGFQTLENMNEAGIAQPTIMLSNISQPEEMEKAKKLGAIGYIVKSNTTLAEIIEQVKKKMIN
ncbi:response regulator [Candidatus Saccharibacteria bacterium]|nr:response regulator [Candidatus Saccharibacteria bacterium]